jgi:SNF2 family DNA or RNA helicase
VTVRTHSAISQQQHDTSLPWACAGQKVATRVVRLIARNTVEQRVLQLQAQRAFSSTLAVPAEQGSEVSGGTLMHFFAGV